MPSIIELPEEILLYIFQLYLKTENQSVFMKTVYNVHPDWKKLCSDCSLWEKYDGTLSFSTMMMMCKEKSFRLTKEFKISPNKSLNDKQATDLFSTLENVNVLDFSNLQKFTSNILPVVEISCPRLREICFSDIENCSSKKILNYKILGTFLSVKGFGLISIDLSHCNLTNAPLLFRCIADCCPNLEQLYLINVSCGNVPVFSIKYFQKKCLKLKVLNLDYNVRISKDNVSEGFPCLEVFYFYDPSGSVMYDQELYSILFNSANLKTLHLPHCNISADILNKLPANALQCLNISKTKACTSAKLASVLRKWCNSLTEVDLSYASNCTINVSVAGLVLTPQQSPLKMLNLNYSSIKPDIVKRVLEKSSHLEVLRLESCRNLGRGMKKVYYGKLELQKLEENLKSFIINKSPEEVVLTE